MKPTIQVCDFEHDHPAGDWSYDDCQAAAESLRRRAALWRVIQTRREAKDRA